MRIPLKTFFKVTGAFIVLIAAGLLVQAISMMQDIGLIGSVMPHVYDLTWLLPEHPIDYEHYVRDHGVAPVFSGEVGVFLKALFGYSAMPSLEEVIAYIGYFVVVYLLVTSRRGQKSAVVEKPPAAALDETKNASCKRTRLQRLVRFFGGNMVNKRFGDRFWIGFGVGTAALLVGAGLYWASPYAATWDEVDFALALRRYDVLAMQPHFPGYPYFVLGGMAVHAFIANPAKALSILNVLVCFPPPFPSFGCLLAICRVQRRYGRRFRCFLQATCSLPPPDRCRTGRRLVCFGGTYGLWNGRSGEQHGWRSFGRPRCLASSWASVCLMPRLLPRC